MYHLTIGFRSSTSVSECFVREVRSISSIFVFTAVFCATFNAQETLETPGASERWNRVDL